MAAASFTTSRSPRLEQTLQLGEASVLERAGVARHDQ
jgi:hypothetical protein